ncbi:hypothetical protein FEM48_Zijuj01G0321000 [Ziziphus jujuba var. spinosa]|uniref:Endoglucanase n=1 Tax=Ziziphus jujuba var. spinosa TaxID=714518 RepID=A0A978W6G0_ZIZJJ|nr:hypothetical protein FEM48_Zijuj01G0321000 [Ziziphus jujuba var. spinosa]
MVVICNLCAIFGLSIFFLWCQGIASIDYKAALTKSLLFYEGQRSGKLPVNQRVHWRADSGLKDGQNEENSGFDLVGGYYDAGDNLKLGFPMAFTITMLSWSTMEFNKQLMAKKELLNALYTIKWGTDYLMKAHPEADVLYGEVGDSDSDHKCWERPEDMTTPRTVFKIDDQHPGSDLAAETAAAFASASIAFRPINPKYAYKLLLFNFACNHPGLYQNSIPAAGKVYPSSGYEDEMVWAAAWLYRATNEMIYLDYVAKSGNVGGTRSMFSWDDKFVGAQVLVAKLVLEGKVEASGKWAEYKSNAEQFICNCIQKGSNNVRRTAGGLLWFLPWDNIQYVTTASFVTTVYSNYLTANHASIQCAGAQMTKPSDLVASVQSQVDYILGSNPRNMSYMVGFGSNFPQQIHHRGASIVSIKKDRNPVTCKGGFDLWYYKNAPNPNVLDGAVVGPDENDGYTDSRSNYQLGEPTLVTNAPLVGVLAHFA